jgi:ribosomal protein L37AE/L43A
MSEQSKRMEITSTDLLACPLCGSHDLRVERYGIECRDCGLWLGDGSRVCEKFGSVHAAWNTRHANAGGERHE